MDMREKLASLPYSYDDFVRFTMRCIEQEDGVKDAIDRQFQVKPDSDTNRSYHRCRSSWMNTPPWIRMR